MKKIIITACFLLSALISLAQQINIQGKVVDEKGEPILGATISVQNTSVGGRTNLDGLFKLFNLKDSTYTVVISYMSYQKKIIEGVVVKEGQSDFINVSLEKQNKELKEVAIKTSYKKESMQALLSVQKNMATISDGISADMIKRTVDRSTGDVLKRVSGITIADNKFAVIRGLADRYNIAMLNGDILPSSESDRKAFSFDIFPSVLLDKITVFKAATADKPSEFSGGIIDLVTKEPSNDNFLNAQIGTGMNTISTFQPYLKGKTSNTDWLGYDKTVRVLPKDFPATDKFYSNSSVFSKAQRYEASKLLQNNWGYENKNSMPMNANFQLSGGYNLKFSEKRSIGALAAVTYNNAYRTQTIQRSDIDGIVKAYDYQDTINRRSTLLGAIFNTYFKINDQHKINFKNTFSSNSDNQVISRSGDFIVNEQYISSRASWFTTNRIWSHQLIGDHVVTKKNIKIHWAGSIHNITRELPDLRKSYYVKNYTDSIYRAYVPFGKGSPFYSGTFFSNTDEKVKSFNLDLTIPYKILKEFQSVKIGGMMQVKNRIYDARVLGYKVANISTYNSSLELLPEGQLFAPENIGDKGYVIDDITQPSDYYTANSQLKAAYIQNDNKVFKNLRFVYGVRIEQFSQELVTGDKVQGDLKIKKENTNILPSLNATYLLNKKTNVRFCASSTLSRPEFRELSPAAFYNYNMLLTYVGNRNLEQTKIQNYDLRYEYFMGKGEMISASIFHKNFDDPIEAVMDLSTKSMSYQNAPNATCQGIEVEFRKSLSFISKSEKSVFSALSVYGNLAYIRSKVKISYSTTGETITDVRPMQGQSPYIINFGAMYSKNDFTVAVAFNRIGERIIAVGNKIVTPHLYEAPRNVLDINITKKFFKKWEAKLSMSDLISNPLIYYYNMENDTKMSYQDGKDFQFMKQRLGSGVGLSLSYQL